MPSMIPTFREIPTIEQVTDQRLQEIEQLELENPPHRCFDCEYCYVVVKENRSRYLDQSWDYEIGFCPEIELFVSVSDLDTDHRCDQWIEA